MLSTDQKGVVAELAIARQAAQLGIGVWGAYTVERYDLIFDLRPTLLRVQCKWACRYDDVVIARSIPIDGTETAFSEGCIHPLTLTRSPRTVTSLTSATSC